MMVAFRAKSYQTFGLPKRPKVTIAVAFGPLREDRKRSENLVKVMTEMYPAMQTVLQEVRFEKGSLCVE